MISHGEGHSAHCGHGFASHIRCNLMTSQTALHREPIERRINVLLEQAAGFVRGGELPGAVARAQFAREELDSHAGVLPGDEWVADGLRARVESTIQEYE